MPCALPKCRDAFRPQKGIPCKQCKRLYHRKCTRQPKDSTEFICDICNNEGQVKESTQSVPLDCNCNFGHSDLVNKIKNLEEEVKSLQEIVRMKDEDINQLKTQIAGQMQQSADIDLSTPKVNAWMTVQKSGAKLQTARKSSEEGVGSKASVTNTNRFLPLQTTDEDRTNLPGNCPLQKKQQNQRKPKVLFLADSNGRYCGEKLREGLGKEYDVCTILKPGAQLNQVMENVDQLTKDFCNEDSVIIHAGSNDLPLTDKDTVSNVTKGITKLKEVAKKTKVIVNFIPARYDSYLLSQKVNKTNAVIEQNISEHNVFINKEPGRMYRNHFARDGLHYNRTGKNALCDRLCSIVKQFFFRSAEIPSRKV